MGLSGTARNRRPLIGMRKMTMMILEHARPAATLTLSPRKLRPICPSEGELTCTEWEIIEMASWDGPRSLHPKGWLSRVETILFGDGALPLANARLEALRRFAVKAWFWKELRDSDIAAVFEVGFSAREIRRIIDHVATRRGSVPHVARWPG